MGGKIGEFSVTLKDLKEMGCTCVITIVRVSILAYIYRLVSCITYREDGKDVIDSL